LSESAPRQKVGLLQLTFLIYGAACGGAFGMEEMVSSSGPGLTLLSLTIVPFVFCVPVALAVGELTAARPVEGGNYRWSQEFVGRFWGFQAGWWAFLTGVATNICFAEMFANYVGERVPFLNHPLQRWLVSLALIWLTYLINLRGIDVVGNAAVLLTFILLTPFVLMTVLGLSQWQYSPFEPFRTHGHGPVAAFGASVGLCIFLYSGFDKLSTVAEEVENPQRTFPPALLFAVVLSIASYVVPTTVALAAKGGWQDWKASHFPQVAAQIGGPWLGYFMAAGAMLSNALLLNVTMLSVSRIPVVLAQDGFLPKVFTRSHPVHGTPAASLLLGSLVYSVACLIDYSHFLIVNAWLQLMTNLLIFENLRRLRQRVADDKRPFHMPGGRPGLFLTTFGVWSLAAVAMWSTVVKGNIIEWRELAVGVTSLLSGVVVYAFLGRAKTEKEP
jgi:amino acid transporter